MDVVLRLMKAIWARWKRAVHGINAAISFVLMTFVYITAMGPVAMWFRLFRPDPIDRGLGAPDLRTYWLTVRAEAQDVRRAQRPW